jgi:hypothetical protein
LAFFENYFTGIDNSLGVLHLNLSNSYKQSNYSIGSLLFNRNQVETNEIGISISGSTDSISIKKIFTDLINENMTGKSIPQILAQSLEFS